MVFDRSEDGLVLRSSDNVPDVIRQVLVERNWKEFDEEKEGSSSQAWNLWWKTQRFRKSEHEEVGPWQRLNHFPRTDAITRKDCLVRNLRRMRCVHGIQTFDFHPGAFILPNEYTKFVSYYAKESQKQNKKNQYWICKPVDLSRGRGIFVFRDLKNLTYDCPVIVQRYITNPWLISGYKFDLRIYVCVPSFLPLTIYIYQEGIVRFGTDKFDLNQLSNVFSHLTNTSINKYGPAYNAAKERIGSGCKWTLSQLRSFLRQTNGVDETLLWYRISNMIALTLATQAPTVPQSKNCFEVFGFDVLVDEQMKPWLLEVNFSPALSIDCQADFIAKRSMISDLIDLLNFKEADKEPVTPKASDEQLSGHSRMSSRFSSTTGLSTRRSQNLTASPQMVNKRGGGNRRSSITTSTKKLKSLTPLKSPGRYSSVESKRGLPSTRWNDILPANEDEGRGEESCDEVDEDRTKPVKSFPRNHSSSSVDSSTSSVDQAASKTEQVNRPQTEILSSRSIKSSCMAFLEKKRSSTPLTSNTTTKKATSTTRKPKFSEYKSPYRATNKTKVNKEAKKPVPWPRTKVGDFVLVFPLSEASRKASQPNNFDMKTIIKEGQKIQKKIAEKSAHRKTEGANTISKSDAMSLDFHLKLDDKDCNPLYFWGPQNPPLLSQVIS